MSVEFYEREGVLRVRMTAGGTGGGTTSEIDLEATEQHVADHPRERAHFAAVKRAAEAAREVQRAEIREEMARAEADAAKLDAAPAGGNPGA